MAMAPRPLLGVRQAFFCVPFTQMRIEPILCYQDPPADEEVNGKIDAARDQKDFDRSVGGRNDLLGRTGDLDYGYGRSKGSRFDHQHQFITVSGECLTHRHGKDDPTKLQKA